MSKTALELVNVLLSNKAGDVASRTSALLGLKNVDLEVDDKLNPNKAPTKYFTMFYSTNLNDGWALLKYLDVDTRYDIVAHCVALNFNPSQTAAYIVDKYLEIKHVGKPSGDEQLSNGQHGPQGGTHASSN